MFGSTTAPSFGAGGGSAFGSSAPTVTFGTAAPSSGFGAAPSSGFVGFGVPTTNFGSSTPSAGLGVPAASGFGAATSGFGATSSSVTGISISGATNQVAQPSTINSKFVDLPQPARDLILSTQSGFKNPMKEGLSAIKDMKSSKLNEISKSLQATKLLTLQLESKLEFLWRETEKFREVAKQEQRDCQRYGRSGIQQVANKDLYLLPYNKSQGSLAVDCRPSDFFFNAVTHIEQRFVKCNEEIDSFSSQFGALVSAVTYALDQSESRNAYGQRQRIGSAQLVQQLQNQNRAFLRLAALIAEFHEECDRLKEIFLSRYCVDGSGVVHSPFLAADREEDARRRRVLHKSTLHAAASQHPQQQQQPQQQLQQPTSQPAGNAFSGFGAFAAPTSTAAAPAPTLGFGFGATTTQTPAAASGGFGFGNLASSGGFGSATPATATAFTAPSAAAGGGFGFGAGSTTAPTAFGSTTAAAPASSFGFGGGTAPSASTSGFGGFGGAGAFGSTSVIAGLDLDSSRSQPKPKSKKR